MNELVQILKNTRQHLMTGVSHMIPFVVSGGILLAVSVMLYGKGAVPDAVADPNLKKLFDIGVAGLTLMVPFLAAYIGYSIAERSSACCIFSRLSVKPGISGKRGITLTPSLTSKRRFSSTRGRFIFTTSRA